MLDQKKEATPETTLKKMKTSSKNNATDLDVNEVLVKLGYANLSHSGATIA